MQNAHVKTKHCTKISHYRISSSPPLTMNIVAAPLSLENFEILGCLRRILRQ